MVHAVDIKATSATRALLACGILMAPLFNLVLYPQAFTRANFGLVRVPLSLLSLGVLGWIQITNFLVTGALTIAAAVGIRNCLRDGFGRNWCRPALIGAYSAGCIFAGIFHPDAALGFPAGTPNGPTVHPSLHRALHGACFPCIMVSLVSACFVFSRRFRLTEERGWSAYSALIGVLTPVLVGTAFATKVWIINMLVGLVCFSWVSLLTAKFLGSNAQIASIPTIRHAGAMPTIAFTLPQLCLASF